METAKPQYSNQTDSEIGGEAVDAAVEAVNEARALALLLRSPRLTVSQVLELLDLGDREFRALVAEHANIRHLLELRRQGALPDAPPTERVCPTCEERYIPYGGARFCSDTCARLASVPGRLPDRAVLPQRD
ncbi:MAG: hypothetical protein AAGG11_03515 [Pseudomonadota bacterium]